MNNIFFSFKRLCRESIVIRNVLSIIYSVLHLSTPPIKLLINKRLDVEWVGSFFKSTSFELHGNGIEILLSPMSRLRNCKIFIKGDNCKLTIGNKALIQNTVLYIEDDNSQIIIGDNFSMYGGHIAAIEGKMIEIGNECLFSTGIEIRNGDSHSIISKTDNKRINHAETVCIGSHVWIGANAKILKGSSIPDDCIVGNSSLVCKKFTESSCVYAGFPAKIVKSDVTWTQSR